MWRWVGARDEALANARFVARRTPEGTKLQPFVFQANIFILNNGTWFQPFPTHTLRSGNTFYCAVSPLAFALPPTNI